MDLLAHLETFVAVAETGGVTRAAEALELPQPLVTRRIQALERAWAAQLFQRAPRGLTLTALGDLTLPYARDVVQRTRHLDEMIAVARRSAVHVVAMPPSCPPRTLARLIAVGGDGGAKIALHEATATARRDGLASGRFAAALLRSAPHGEAMLVVTGLARRPDSARPVRRLAHLASLRPRRGGAPDETSTLLMTPEDDLEPFADAVRRAAARAGLSETRVRGVASAAAGAAEVIADGGALLCDARTARATGLVWTRLDDQSLYRGYELAAGGVTGTLGRDLLAALRVPAADAIGAVGDAAALPDGEPVTADRDDDERLAAHGA